MKALLIMILMSLMTIISGCGTSSVVDSNGRDCKAKTCVNVLGQ